MIEMPDDSMPSTSPVPAVGMPSASPVPAVGMPTATADGPPLGPMTVPPVAVDEVPDLERTDAPFAAPLSSGSSSGSSSSSSGNIGPIVGVVFGVVALICITAVVIVFVYKRESPAPSANEMPPLLALSDMNPPPTSNEESTPEATLSAYAIPMPLQEGNNGASPARSSGTENKVTPKDDSNLPVFKDQARTAMPPSTSIIPTVDATPVEDSKVELDAPNERNDIGNTPTRQRGIDP